MGYCEYLDMLSVLAIDEQLRCMRHGLQQCLQRVSCNVSPVRVKASAISVTVASGLLWFPGWTILEPTLGFLFVVCWTFGQNVELVVHHHRSSIFRVPGLLEEGWVALAKRDQSLSTGPLHGRDAADSCLRFATLQFNTDSGLC